MIELYRKNNCPACEEIEEAFKEMVLAYKVIIVNDKSNFKLPENINLPAIKDDKKIISGRKNIKQYLEDLNDFLAEWNKFQSDSCYIDKDGSTC